VWRKRFHDGIATVVFAAFSRGDKAAAWDVRDVSRVRLGR
jgi:hypothetical protein